MNELINSASELGADLHTLSHRLHSSTLQRLGLVRESRRAAKNLPRTRACRSISPMAICPSLYLLTCRSAFSASFRNLSAT